jgi:hypothetical protein
MNACTVVELSEPPLYENYTVYQKSSQTSLDLVDNQCQEILDCTEGERLNTRGCTIESGSEETEEGCTSGGFQKNAENYEVRGMQV